MPLHTTFHKGTKRLQSQICLRVVQTVVSGRQFGVDTARLVVAVLAVPLNIVVVVFGVLLEVAVCVVGYGVMHCLVVVVDVVVFVVVAVRRIEVEWHYRL